MRGLPALQRSRTAPVQPDAEDHGTPRRVPSDPRSDREHVPEEDRSTDGSRNTSRGPIVGRWQHPGPRTDAGASLTLLATLIVAAIILHLF